MLYIKFKLKVYIISAINHSKPTQIIIYVLSIGINLRYRYIPFYLFRAIELGIILSRLVCVNLYYFYPPR